MGTNGTLIFIALRFACQSLPTWTTAWESFEDHFLSVFTDEECV